MVRLTLCELRGAGWAQPQNSVSKAESADGPLPPWQSSAKIEFLLRLLSELRERNAAAAQQCAPWAPWLLSL